MTQFTVDFGDLDSTAQLLDRQADHCDRVSRYIHGQCTIPSGELGLLLQFLHPVNELIVDVASDIERGLGSLAAHAASAVRGARDDYAESEVSAQQAYRGLATGLPGGGSLPPTQDPREARAHLGPAQSSAPSDYGTEPHAAHPLEDLVASATGLAEQAHSLVTDTVATAQDRFQMYGEPGVVTERSDASSYLVPAQDAQETWVEEVRSKAGVIIGGVDWVAEQFIGISILEEYVLKPFAGDWHALGRASASWGNAATAMRECAGNTAALPGQLTSWTGAGATAFLGSMTGISGGMLAAGYGFDVVSGVVDKVTTVAKLAARAC